MSKGCLALQPQNCAKHFSLDTMPLRLVKRLAFELLNLSLNPEHLKAKSFACNIQFNFPFLLYPFQLAFSKDFSISRHFLSALLCCDVKETFSEMCDSPSNDRESCNREAFDVERLIYLDLFFFAPSLNGWSVICNTPQKFLTMYLSAFLGYFLLPR